MSLPSLADLPAFVERLPGALAREDETRVAALIADASAQVRVVSGRDWLVTGDDGDEWAEYDDVANVDTARQIVVRVVLAAAYRAFDNPDGIISETTGSYSETRSRSSVASGVALTDAEERTLRLLVGRSNVVSVPIQHPDLSTSISGETEYLDVVGGGDPLPWLHPDDAL